jgi:uncharacterized membrane protein SpoIIM required for sporulation
MYNIISISYLCYLSFFFVISIIATFIINIKYKNIGEHIISNYGNKVINLSISTIGILKNNLRSCLFGFILSIFGLQLLIVIFDGVIIGMLISKGMEKFSFFRTMFLLIPHGFTEIFGSFIASSAGFKIFNIIVNWELTEGIIWNIFFTILISILLTIISAIIETKITPKINGIRFDSIKNEILF